MPLYVYPVDPHQENGIEAALSALLNDRREEACLELLPGVHRLFRSVISTGRSARPAAKRADHPRQRRRGHHSPTAAGHGLAPL